MMSVFQILYTSKVSPTTTEDDIAKLLHHSHRSNSRRGVTGILMHRDNTFIQLLEGPEQLLKNLHKKIAKDPRHYDVTVIFERHSENRFFPKWSMGYSNITDDDLHIGNVDIPWEDFADEADLLLTIDFLLSFQDRDLNAFAS